MTHLEWALKADSKIACTKIGSLDLNLDLIKTNSKVKFYLETFITEKYSITTAER